MPPIRRRALLTGAAALAACAALPQAASAARLVTLGRHTPLSLTDILGDALKGWWSADDRGTSRMTDDGSGLISAWVDRISGISVTAATTARPTWGAASFNSRAGLAFDGTANCLVSTSYLALPTGSTAGEIWVVGRQDAAAADATQRAAVRIGTGAAAARSVSRFVVGGVNRFQVDDQTTVLRDTVVDDSAYFIGAGAWSDTTMAGRLNGAATSPASAGIGSLNTNTSRMRIGAATGAGATLFWQGPIRHVIVTTMLTPAQQLQLEGWLAWDCGLTALLPATHPYKTARP